MIHDETDDFESKDPETTPISLSCTRLSSRKCLIIQKKNFNVLVCIFLLTFLVE